MINSRTLLSLLVIGSIASVWYVQICFDLWAEQDLASMPREEMFKLLVARTFYVVPKVLVVYAVFIIITRRAQLKKIIGAAWIVAVLHTLTFYGAFEISLELNIEKVRLLVHHLIPHMYFAVVTFLTYRLSLIDKDHYEFKST
jgi:hypothetical protein